MEMFVSLAVSGPILQGRKPAIPYKLEKQKIASRTTVDGAAQL
jgi:hypothetical protein